MHVDRMPDGATGLSLDDDGSEWQWELLHQEACWPRWRWVSGLIVRHVCATQSMKADVVAVPKF